MSDKKTITIMAFPIMLILMKLYIEMGIASELFIITLMLPIILVASFVVGVLMLMPLMNLATTINGVIIIISISTIPLLLVLFALSNTPELTAEIFAKKFIIPLSIGYGILIGCSYNTIDLYIDNQKIKNHKKGNNYG